MLLSLRVPRREPFTLPELVAAGSVHPELAPVLAALVRGRANGLLTGATGTGKTTLLSALLSLAGPDERLVLVEEVPELAPEHPHVVGLVVRRANVEGAGGVDLAALVRHALADAPGPDRAGRGARGGAARGAHLAQHRARRRVGDRCTRTTSRTCPPGSRRSGRSPGLDVTALAAQAGSALDVVVHLRRADGVRRVDRVGLVDGRMRVVEALAVTDAGALRHGPAWPELAARWPARP